MNITMGFNQNQILKNQSANNTSTVLAGTSDWAIIAPATGCLGFLKQMTFDVAAPTGAGSGTHSLTVCTNIMGYNQVIDIVEAYNHSITLCGLSTMSTTAATFPSDKIALTQSLKDLPFSSTDWLLMSYSNNTNVSQTNTRYYIVDYLEVAEAAPPGG